MKSTANLFTVATQQQLATAEVTVAKQGIPQRIHDGQDELSVQLLSHTLPYLQTGDRVVFTHLEEGVMVLYHIKNIKEHQPAYNAIQPDADTIKLEAGAASITLKAEDGIQFKVNNHQMVLNHQGHFIAQASEITLNSKTDITLAAPGNQVHVTTKEK